MFLAKLSSCQTRCQRFSKQEYTHNISPSWDRLIDPHPLVNFVPTPYKNYPFFYNVSRLTLSLSLHEGGPLLLLEGMRCGTSTLATNTGFALMYHTLITQKLYLVHIAIIVYFRRFYLCITYDHTHAPIISARRSILL